MGVKTGVEAADTGGCDHIIREAVPTLGAVTTSSGRLFQSATTLAEKKVAFSSLTRILGDCLTVHCPPALFF